jgi:hypothetical protein
MAASVAGAGWPDLIRQKFIFSINLPMIPTTRRRNAMVQ